MKNSILILLSILAFGCNTEKNTNSETIHNDQMEEKALVFNELDFYTDSTNYEQKINNDSAYWDTVMYNGTLKTKKLKTSPNNLEVAEIEIPESVERLSSKQANAGFKELLKTYGNQGLSSEEVMNPTSRSIWQSTDSFVVILEKYKVNFEYSEIAVITIWKKEKLVYTYSIQNKLGVILELTGLETEGSEILLYGNQQGNPEFSYGGEFFITFNSNSRIISYSYFEQTR